MGLFVNGRRGLWSLATVMLLSVASLLGIRCDGVSLPVFVEGVAVTDSEVPELTIVSPSANLSVSQGQGLQVEWRDADQDSAAIISFSLISVDDPTFVVPLVSGISENPDGASDRFTASTAFIPLGAYTLRGTISDGLNRDVTAVAFNQMAGLGEVVIQIVEEGTTSIVNRPPQVFVRDPSFNLSVSQDDVVVVRVQPTARDTNLMPEDDEVLVDDAYDPDSTSTLYLVLDRDNDPLNDNVIAPDPSQIIPIAEPTEITAGDNQPIDFPITVDLETIPLRMAGEPYFIRATITDGLNTAVHSYARGTINVVRAATGRVLLESVGRTTSGGLFRGFNPGARLGTRMKCLEDFDNDGIDDFILVAQFGNPRNFGNMGEAYLLYGQNNLRFGGEINVNSTSQTIPGVLFEGPPTRCLNEECAVSDRSTTDVDLKVIPNARTDGISDVTHVPDLDGDGRPEILIGMQHVDGVYQARDDDPDDDPPDGDETVGVNITLRQGPDGLDIDVVGGTPIGIQGYNGASDTTISSGQPDMNFRTDDLEWVRTPGDTRFALIKFSDIFESFPANETAIDIGDIGGTLRFNILNGGGPATIHELFTDFDPATVTFNNFAGGQEPVPGVDYAEEELDNIDADEVGDTIQVDLDDLLNRLLINDLPNNELRFIIVPGDADEEDSDDNVRASSSEFTDTRQRPSVSINFSRLVQGGPEGCYPDLLPNNFSDNEGANPDNGQNEDKMEAVGFAAMLSSRNRDNDGLINPDRLADTTVAIELIGQRARSRALGSGLIAECEDDEDGRIAGMRFQAGWYDFHDAALQDQPPLEGLFGRSVSFLEDIDLNGRPEIVISAPRNELDLAETMLNFGSTSSHVEGRWFDGSIMIVPGTDFDLDFLRDRAGEEGSSVYPHPNDESTGGCDMAGTCDPRNPRSRCGQDGLAGEFGVYAEDMTDFLGGARGAGDFNLDAVPDLMCGAPLNDLFPDVPDTGAFYILYLRAPTGDIDLSFADDPFRRPPMLRIRGETPGDRIGLRQEAILDVNGDRIDDVMIASGKADFILPPPDCQADLSGIGLDLTTFNSCRTDDRNDEVFMDDFCKPYDFNNDRLINDEDRSVFDCLVGGGGSSCCPVDNGYVGILFGGVNRQGDRTISQLGTTDLPGVVFYGSSAGDNAGFDISSAGDFDRDGFGDILITAPGETRFDDNGRERMGVTYLIFGGPYLEEQEAPIDLSEVGARIPGIVFLSPYQAGAPDEAPTDHVGFVGDINNDGFTDIAIGVSRADLVDPQFPQGDGTFPGTGRSPDQGDIYLIYGNNINR